MEIYKHFYNTYGSVEEEFQKRYGKKKIDETLKPLSEEDKEEIENMDLLDGIEDYMLGK